MANNGHDTRSLQAYLGHKNILRRIGADPIQELLAGLSAACDYLIRNRADQACHRPITPIGQSFGSEFRSAMRSKQARGAVMFRFVTIIPFSFWVIILLLAFMWVAFGLWGMVATVVAIVLLESGRTSIR